MISYGAKCNLQNLCSVAIPYTHKQQVPTSDLVCPNSRCRHIAAQILWVTTHLAKGADVLMVGHVLHGQGGGPRAATVGDALDFNEVWLPQCHQLGIVGHLSCVPALHQCQPAYSPTSCTASGGEERASHKQTAQLHQVRPLSKPLWCSLLESAIAETTLRSSKLYMTSTHLYTVRWRLLRSSLKHSRKRSQKSLNSGLSMAFRVSLVAASTDTYNCVTGSSALQLPIYMLLLMYCQSRLLC